MLVDGGSQFAKFSAFKSNCAARMHGFLTCFKLTYLVVDGGSQFATSLGIQEVARTIPPGL
eukprot:scaffold13965_cov72-Skeletonema_dohrnii-CCMP3373.AAC.4